MAQTIAVPPGYARVLGLGAISHRASAPIQIVREGPCMVHFHKAIGDVLKTTRFRNSTFSTVYLHHLTAMPPDTSPSNHTRSWSPIPDTTYNKTIMAEILARRQPQVRDRDRDSFAQKIPSEAQGLECEIAPTECQLEEASKATSPTTSSEGVGWADYTSVDIHSPVEKTRKRRRDQTNPDHAGATCARTRPILTPMKQEEANEQWMDGSYPPPSGLAQYSKRQTTRQGGGDSALLDERPNLPSSPSTAGSASLMSFTEPDMAPLSAVGSSSVSMPRTGGRVGGAGWLSSPLPSSLEALPSYVHWDKLQSDESEKYRLNFRIVYALGLEPQELEARRRRLQRELDALHAAMNMSPRQKRKHMAWYGDVGDICDGED